MNLLNKKNRNGLIVLLVISCWLVSNITILHAQECPNTPHLYYPAFEASPAGAKYNSGESAIVSGDYQTGILTVIWPHVGDGYIIWVGDGVELHVPVMIRSYLYFTSGPDYLCSGQTATFTIYDNCSSSTSFTWSAPDGWSINGGGNSLITSSKSVNIQAPLTNSSTGVISVTSNNSVTANKTIQVGIPSSDQISVQGDVQVCPNSSSYTYYIQNTSGVPITESHWEMPAGFTILSQDNNSVTVSTGSDVDLQMIELTIRTACSTDWQGPWYFEVEEGSCFSSFSMVPNPSSSQVEVSVPSLQSEKPIQSPSTTSSNFLVQIHDRLGVPVHTSKQNNNSFSLNTSDLKDGLYIVSVSNGRKVYRKTLLVKH